METIEALRNTPIGQLNHCKPWDELSPFEKKTFLDDLSSPPPISINVTVHRTQQSTRTTNITHTPSPLPSSPQPPSPVPTPPTTPPPCSFNDTSDFLSPVNVIRDDINDYLEENEDAIMKEVEANMIRWRDYFKSIAEQQTYVSGACRRRGSIREEVKQIQTQEEEEEEKELKKMIDEKLNTSEKNYLSHYKSLKEEIQRNEEKRQQEMKQLREARMEHIKAMKAQFEYYEQQSMNVTQAVAVLIQSCQHPSFLDKNALITVIEHFNKLIDDIIKTSTAARQSESPKEETLQTVQLMFKQSCIVLVKLQQIIEKANNQGKEELEKMAELEKQKKEKEEKERKLQQPVKVSIGGDVKGTVTQPQTQQQQQQQQTQQQPLQQNNNNVSIGVTVSPNALQSYTTYQEMIENSIKNTDALAKSSDPKVKKYRFELQKAVNTPVCGISAQSGEHLADKIKRLKQLLSGENVGVVGGMVSAREHPEAKIYCLNFLAKKLVKQGEEQVSSRPITAFPIAGVIVHLSCEFPELMHMFIAHCQASCPLLVPMYFEKNHNNNNIEWHRLQGYRVSSDGAIEKDDLYLKRIGGVVKLYAAVMQTTILHMNKPHPYGLEHCWVWLARVLNVVPRPNITATAIYMVLEVCGCAMLKKYGRQFQKMIHLLHKDYLPRIANVTPDDHQGPYSRLKMFLDDCLSRGVIPEPEGSLSADFWRSHSKSNIVGL